MRLSRRALIIGVTRFAMYVIAIGGVLAIVHPARAASLAPLRALLPITGPGSLALALAAIAVGAVALRRERGGPTRHRREARAGLLLGLAHPVLDGLFFVVSAIFDP